ncbi:uncharacterized protein LOC119654028 [Hermetia illucens]|uniref:uncharacterized protein LOC119654028 n=1 Tax=Hermetia illucens TaxID=343691 RepID=UPI0018CC572D|nr:uncharacterized protein LOC119654028 [Hermetia illucens]
MTSLRTGLLNYDLSAMVELITLFFPEDFKLSLSFLQTASEQRKYGALSLQVSTLPLNHHVYVYCCRRRLYGAYRVNHAVSFWLGPSALFTIFRETCALPASFFFICRPFCKEVYPTAPPAFSITCPHVFTPLRF